MAVDPASLSDARRFTRSCLQALRTSAFDIVDADVRHR
jgi:hypothetical protein